MVALINETQTVLSFSKIIKFNAVMYLNSFEKSNVPKPKEVNLNLPLGYNGLEPYYYKTIGLDLDDIFNP